MRRIAILILAVFLLSSTYVPASASNVSITVEGQQIHATYALSLVQNVTALPNVVTSVDSTSDSNVSAVFVQALRSVNPSATPSNLSIELVATHDDLNLTCTFDVLGVSQRKGDLLNVNMTWLPFIVRSDLRAQNFSFNTIGSRYLRPVVTFYTNASRFVGRPNATITGVTFFVNGTSVGPPAAQDYVGNFTTLNFGDVSPTVSQWNRTYTLTNNTTTWRYFPSKLLNFDMRIERRNVTLDYIATYGYNVTISVQGIGRTLGSVVLVDVGMGHTELMMAVIVILAIVSTVFVQLRYSSKKRLVKSQKK